MAQLSLSGIIIADDRSLASADDPGPAAGPARLDGLHLDRALSALAPRVEEIVWVCSDPAALLNRDGLIVSDHFQPPGLLSAIHAGLFSSRHDHALVLAANQPPPSSSLLDLLLRAVAPRWDAVLLQGAGEAQPLPAVYHKRCLKLLGRQLAEGRRPAGGFLRQLHRHLIPEDLVRQADEAWKPLLSPEMRRPTDPKSEE